MWFSCSATRKRRNRDSDPVGSYAKGTVAEQSDVDLVVSDGVEAQSTFTVNILVRFLMLAETYNRYINKEKLEDRAEGTEQERERVATDLIKEGGMF